MIAMVIKALILILFSDHSYDVSMLHFIKVFTELIEYKAYKIKKTLLLTSPHPDMRIPHC